MKKGEKLKGGFTIIEVVLVLAVAGLIFAMAFIAVPALQRSQRDNTRRDDMMKFVTEVKRYQTSNRGNLPSGTGEVNWGGDAWKSECPKNLSGTWAGFYCSYLGERFMDPDGVNYTLNVMECKASSVGGDCESAVSDKINKWRNESLNDTERRTMLVVTRGKCDGNNIVGSSSPRNLAVLYRLEGSGAYCYGT